MLIALPFPSFDLFGSPSWIHIGLSALIQTEKFARYSKECGAMIGSAFDQGRVPSLQELVPHAIELRGSPISDCVGYEDEQVNNRDRTAAAAYGAWNPGLESELPREYLPLATIFRAENVTNAA